MLPNVNIGSPRCLNIDTVALIGTPLVIMTTAGPCRQTGHSFRLSQYRLVGLLSFNVSYTSKYCASYLRVLQVLFRSLVHLPSPTTLIKLCFFFGTQSNIIRAGWESAVYFLLASLSTSLSLSLSPSCCLSGFDKTSSKHRYPYLRKSLLLLLLHRPDITKSHDLFGGKILYSRLTLH